MWWNEFTGKGSWTKAGFSFQLVRTSSTIFHLWKSYFLQGFQSKELIISSGLTLGDIDQYPTLDITFDGADEYVVPFGASLTRSAVLTGNLGYIESTAISIASREAELANWERKSWQRLLKRRFIHPITTIHIHRFCSFVVVADYRKNVSVLGTNVSRPLTLSSPSWMTPSLTHSSRKASQ